MVQFPNAKINLGLSVTERRSDGYHNLETVFYPVPLCDVLEVIRGETFSFRVSGWALDGPEEENLVVRAWRLLQVRFGLPPVTVRLHKVIPSGAGLGGGSSDAAFMLKMVNDLFSLALSEAELEAEAGKLGADCPFFIRNTPSFATGTGNILSPAEVDLAGFHLVLVKPPLHVHTGKAYQAITPRQPAVSVQKVVQQPVDSWKGTLTNDFEEPVFNMFPMIREIKEELYRRGAVYASMSGSGSAVFGLFRESPGDLPEAFSRDCFIFFQAL
jgi:4-diphosphocytidyl-2-C-methyl-D-erythritol kinase